MPKNNRPMPFVWTNIDMKENYKTLNQALKITAFMWLFLSIGASAEPIVIKDYGKAKPIGWVVKGQRTLAASPRDPVKDLLTSRWPLNTSLSIGKVKQKALPKNMEGKLQTPIFIIGSDQTSQKWLNNKKPSLLAMEAKGILVESPSEHHYRQIVALAKPLTIEVMAIDDIAYELGLKHYPAIISNKGISQ
jgi:integrating conjugative element protein (TIGR03765 family)